MPSTRAKRCGVGAECSVLIKKLHPGNVVAARFPVPAANERLDYLVATHEGPVTRKGRTANVVFFTSPSFPGETIYAFRSLTKVTKEGVTRPSFLQILRRRTGLVVSRLRRRKSR